MINDEKIKTGSELSEDEELTLLSREMKQRRESLIEFEKANREDLVEQTNNAIKLVGKYLPVEVS